MSSFGPSSYDNAVAAARSCYSGRIITAEEVGRDERSREARDRIANETYEAGHHTILQHAAFQFAIEGVSRQCIWSFLHSHPFYNSEQVSQRYVEVKPGNVLLPELGEREEGVYRAAVEAQMVSYRALLELLSPKVSEEYFRLFPGRRRSKEKWASAVKKRAQEVARYVLPIGTLAHLYHTVSGLTLHRYHRLCRQLDVPAETALVVEAMVSEVSRVDPLYFRKLEDPLPLEETLEYAALKERGRLELGGSREYRSEFDRRLGPYRSRLVDYKVSGAESVAQGVRDVLGLARGEMGDESAIELVLSPAQNRYLGEALTLTTLSKLTRALSHAHFTFQKKLSHSADSQDQRHRMAPASRPVLFAHFEPGEVDVVVPGLIEAVPEARELYLESMRRTWVAIGRLLEAGVSAELALYLVPNAFPIRFLESGDLLHLHHKWVQRLCFNAQEEIWRASLEEVLQVRKVHPLLARHLLPPCGLRKEAGRAPFCPEGPRYCGVPAWGLELEQLGRVL
ncbi:MAG: FAD-dependent thymidylate synthase [Myxococcales bacterium]|nr:FAD-dependent thymidylate synthase [Myxococcales bacterium]